MHRRILQGLLLSTGLLTAGGAAAQTAIRDPMGLGGLSMGISQPLGFGGLNISANPRLVNAPGFRLGESAIVHAGVSVGAGVDTNVFYQDTGSQSAAMTRVLPHLVLTNSGRGAQPNMGYHLAVGADYRQYITDAQPIKDQGAAVGVGVDGSLDFGLQSPWTFSLLGRFARDVQASYIPGTGQFERIVGQPGARIRWRPGGGRWEQVLTYSVLFDHFQNVNLSRADSISHYIDFYSQFRFLPKTAIYLDFNQGFVNWSDNPNTIGKSDSKPMRITLGLNGMITTKMLVDLYAGYGNGFYQNGPSPSTVIGGAAFAFNFSHFSRARLGYERNFNNSLYGNYFDADAVFASLEQRIGQSFILGASARFEHRVYRCIPGTTNAVLVCAQDMAGQDRSDNWLAIGAGASYFPLEWMSIGAGYQVLTNLTDFSLPGVGIDNKVSFVKHQVVGTLSFTY